MNELDIQELVGVYRAMENSALQILTAEGMSRDAMEFARSLDMSYEGQHHYVETPVPSGELKENNRAEISNSFESLHETRYGHRIKAPLVTINARLKAIGRIKDVPVAEVGQGKEIPPGAVKPGRQVYLDGELVDSQIYERAGLLCGNSIAGPAIIEEPFHTTVVMPGQTLQVDKLGNLIIEVGGA
jgi:N-methylhydantoinase A